MFLVSLAHAQDATPTAIGGAGNFIPIILIFIIFYFLLIRPQSKRLKEHDNMVKALQRNDTVVTGGGIIGKITKVNDQSNTLELEIAPDVRVKVIRSTVSEVVDQKGKAANDDTSKKKPTKKPKTK